MLERKYRAQDKAVALAIFEFAEELGAEATIIETGSVNEGPFEVKVVIDGFEENIRISKLIRIFHTGIIKGFQLGVQAEMKEGG